MTYECQGKRQHVSYSAAERALQRRQDMHGSFQIYFCDRCQFWHIGNGMKAKGRDKARGSGLYRMRREKGFE